MSSNNSNVDQIKYWNSQAGEQWVKGRESMDKTLFEFGQLAIDALNLSSGNKVLDIGCGCGGTSFSLATKVADGRVEGVDISEPMLAHAKERRVALDIGNVDFIKGDAAVKLFSPQSFDRVFSRFGVMFFDDPVSAFKNIRSSLKSAGKLSFVCWRQASENQWTMVPTKAALKYVTIPNAADKNAPGPFAFADKVRTASILEQAGFKNVVVEAKNLPMRFPIVEGKSLGQQFAEIGPVGRIVATADDDVKQQVMESMTAALQEFVNGSQVEMDGAVWLVTADNE
ncbi:MAG: ubiquinone/menaquinone biosynthesis C-methylase UbiE [Oceanicoccus sp.]|jgi:ubiquinone/menaquinone biosynthesis C-methylase UbiE